MIRDAKGNAISYERVGLLPLRISPMVLGLVMVDHYEIIYQNEKGKRKIGWLHLIL